MTDKVLKDSVVRWGVIIIGALVVSGAVSLANRDVYSKAQVDTKFEHKDALQLERDGRIMDKLEAIKEDTEETKDAVNQHVQEDHL